MILQGNCLEVLRTLQSESVNMCITSPPYYKLRNYGNKDQLGQEKTPQEYIHKLCDIFDATHRIITNDGTCWVNLGDSYDPKTKCLIGVPAMFQLEMVRRGWILRNIIIWNKPNCMPSSVKDRYTIDFEYLFFFSKNKKYFFKTQYEPRKTSSEYSGGYSQKNEIIQKTVNATDITRRIKMGKERIKRCVWQVSPTPFKEAHFATYPEKLIEGPIDACCPVGGVVMDCFFGAGTTGVVAKKQKKNFIGIELNQEYIEIAQKRIDKIQEDE
jgi:site-specific DNA-methyltransferase (adenine-specific)